MAESRGNRRVKNRSKARMITQTASSPNAVVSTGTIDASSGPCALREGLLQSRVVPLRLIRVGHGKSRDGLVERFALVDIACDHGRISGFRVGQCQRPPAHAASI